MLWLGDIAIRRYEIDLEPVNMSIDPACLLTDETFRLKISYHENREQNPINATK